MTLFECIAAMVMLLLAIVLLCVAIELAPRIWTHTLAVAKASAQLAQTIGLALAQTLEPIVRIAAPFALFVAMFSFAARREISQRSTP